MLRTTLKTGGMTPVLQWANSAAHSNGDGQQPVAIEPLLASCIPSFCKHQITPKTSRYTRCSMSMLPNVSITRTNPILGPIGEMVVQYQPLPKQRMRPTLHRVRLQPAVITDALARRTQQRQNGDRQRADQQQTVPPVRARNMHRRESHPEDGGAVGGGDRAGAERAPRTPVTRAPPRCSTATRCLRSTTRSPAHFGAPHRQVAITCMLRYTEIGFESPRNLEEERSGVIRYRDSALSVYVMRSSCDVV